MRYLLLSLSCFLISCGNQYVEPAKISVDRTDISLEQEILRELNSVRAKKGLKPVKYSKPLSHLSRKHSHFMSANEGKFSLTGKKITHYGFSGRSHFAKHNLNFSDVSEVVVAGWGQRGNMAKIAVDEWLRSPNHRFFVYGNYEYFGVGVCTPKPGSFFATGLFGNKALVRGGHGF